MYKFSSDLEDSVLIRSHLNDDLSLAFDQFNSTLQSMIDNHAPIIRRSVTLRPYAPWFTDKIKVAKRKRRKLLSFQRLRAIDMYQFSSDLEDCVLIRSHLNDDLSLAFDQFNSTLQSMIDNHAPIIRRSVTLCPYAPQFTDEI